MPFDLCTMNIVHLTLTQILLPVPRMRVRVLLVPELPVLSLFLVVLLCACVDHARGHDDVGVVGAGGQAVGGGQDETEKKNTFFA